MKILFLTNLVIALNLIAISAVAGAEANGGAGGGGVRSGFKSIQGSSFLANSSVGNFGHESKKLGGSQVGTLSGNSGGTMNNGQGNMQLVGGAEANSGNSGGGGVRPTMLAKPSGHEI